MTDGKSTLPLWRDTPPPRRQTAAGRLHADFIALILAGFTREEALKLITALITS